MSPPITLSKKGWDNPPAVIVVGGSHEYLVHREIQKALRAANKTGRRVQDIPCGDTDSLYGALSGCAVFSDPTLVVLHSEGATKTQKWLDAELQTLIAHAVSGDNDVSVVLFVDGEVSDTTFAMKVVSGAPKNTIKVLSFESPKPWDMAASSSKFFTTEIERRGMHITPELVAAVVRQAGTDYGVLSFEALKLEMLLKSSNRTTVEIGDLRGFISSIGASSWGALGDSLSAKNLKMMLRSFQDVRKEDGDTKFIPACVRLENMVIPWLQTAYLLEKGLPQEECASRMKVHPYVFGKNLMLPAKKWGSVGCARLIREISYVGGRARSGLCGNPWVRLEAGLIGVFRG